MKSEILPQLDFSDWDVCLDCIKGKQTKYISKNPATRSSQLLELIHTDICGPFDAPSFGVKSILSLLLMISHVIVIYTYFMKSLNQWMYLRLL